LPPKPTTTPVPYIHTTTAKPPRNKNKQQQHHQQKVQQIDGKNGNNHKDLKMSGPNQILPRDIEMIAPIEGKGNFS
jgi:hypothetical protein